jgi:hypothetical protein
MDQLYVNGQRQIMARYPNYDEAVRPYNGFAADAFSPERAARWADPAGGFIHAMHVSHWGGYHYLIKGKNSDNTITYEGGWQNNRQMGMHDAFRFVENIFEELDAPGEWFHDRKTQILYFYPPKGVDLTLRHRGGLTFESPGRIQRLAGKAGALHRSGRAYLPARSAHLHGDQGALAAK